MLHIIGTEFFLSQLVIIIYEMTNNFKCKYKYKAFSFLSRLSITLDMNCSYISYGLKGKYMSIFYI